MGKFGMLLNTMRIRLIVGSALVLASLGAAQPRHALNLMPMPSSIQAGVGQLPVDRSFSVAIMGFKDATLERGTQRFVTELSREAGTQQHPRRGGHHGSALLLVCSYIDVRSLYAWIAGVIHRPDDRWPEIDARVHRP